MTINDLLISYSVLKSLCLSVPIFFIIICCTKLIKTKKKYILTQKEFYKNKIIKLLGAITGAFISLFILMSIL